MAMEECAENLSSITHFAPATTAGLRSKCLWQYFGGVKDVAGKKVPHGLGVKRFAHERTQSHLTRVESGRWVLGELDGCPSLPTPASSLTLTVCPRHLPSPLSSCSYCEIVGFMFWTPREPGESKSGNHKPEWGRYVGRERNNLHVLGL